MPKKYNSQATIETILTVSAKMFLEKGFDKTSMRDIAETAGISKGAIYHHFQSKEEIMKAVTQRQEQAIKSVMDEWISETGSLNGKEKLTFILEKNIESQTARYLDDVMCVSMKSADFVLALMKDNVNKDSLFISEIIRQGIADGSLITEFPDECAEVFLLLANVWCDPAVFECNMKKLKKRLLFLQSLMKSMGIDVLSDNLLEKTMEVLQKLYKKEDQIIE